MPAASARTATITIVLLVAIYESLLITNAAFELRKNWFSLDPERIDQGLWHGQVRQIYPDCVQLIQIEGESVLSADAAHRAKVRSWRWRNFVDPSESIVVLLVPHTWSIFR
jgi:hypothetical protein